MNRKAFANFARLAGASVVAQLIPLLALPALARLFSAAEIGAWTLFGAMASNVATIACGRYEYAIVLPRTHSHARLAFLLCLVVAAGVAGLSLVAVLLMVSHQPARWGTWMLWLPPMVACTGTIQALTMWHNRQGDFGRVGGSRIAVPVTTTSLQLLAGWSHWGVHGLVAAQAAGSALGVVWLAWRSGAIAATGWMSHVTRRLQVIARRYRDFPLVNAPHAFINALQETLTLALLAAMAGPATAGHYGLMSRIAKAPASLVGSALSEVLLGMLARMWARGEDIRPLLRRCALALVAFALPLAIGLAAAGPWLFAAVLGSEWAIAGEYARWFAPYLFGHFVIGPLTAAPMVIGCQRQAFLLSVAGNLTYVLAIALTLAFTPDVRLACGMVSLLVGGYFAYYWLWLMRAIARQRVAAGHD